MNAAALDLDQATYTDMIDDLHALWTPHSGQIPIGEALFYDWYTSLFIMCGRKFGKTEYALYCLWRIAYMFPGSPCYYIAPYQKQAKEIVWADPRIKNFGPRHWLLDGSKGVNDSELRIKFKNGSFIKVDGSDNFNAYRGVKYKICIYEEYKDHRPEFRHAMNPNASVLEGINMYIGSPPEIECDYTLLADEHQKDPTKFYYHAPTWTNPYISKKWLKSEKSSLYLRGEGDVWEREYAARFVKGGSSSIYPMLNKSIVKPHEQIMREIHRDRKKLQWYAWADPAGASCFAVLFAAINPYTKKIYLLDEIYEKDQSEMTTSRIGRRVIEIRDELYYRSEDWTIGYDEAATWFANEWHDNFPEEEGLQPTHKSVSKKEVGLSLIKDALLLGLVTMSDRCKNLYWEMDRYAKDKNGRIPKVDDHLNDSFRYLLSANGYSLNGVKEIIKENDPDWRGARIEDDFPSLREGNFSSENWEDFN